MALHESALDPVQICLPPGELGAGLLLLATQLLDRGVLDVRSVLADDRHRGQVGLPTLAAAHR
ncbi:hypothetical protein [Serinicoccus profundi]|uniref:hypothetical protein n=1 Tax=Serinicoccus profundi TaxID=1078471 RepID=UPI0011C75FBF|nr:hypothetical protein [Serinicoccus profundi]